MGEDKGTDPDVLLKILGVMTDHPWLPILITIVLLIVSIVVLQLGLKTTFLQRFGILPTGGIPATQSDPLLKGAQQVEEVKKLGADVIQGGTNELTFTKKMKNKSTRIVEAAENGELKQAMDKCKIFMSSVEASNFACKIFVNSWEDIEGVDNFEKIVENIGKQLELPEDDIQGIKLSALGGKGRKDYLAFECAMKNGGKVRLHTGGYQVFKNDTEAGERIDFQIALNYMDMSDITLKKLPETVVEDLEKKWFQSRPSVEYQKPEEGEDWNSYFQYKAHKNILKELHE